MGLSFFSGLFSSGTKKFDPLVNSINAFEPELQTLPDEALRERSLKLRDRVQGGTSLDEVLPEAFALVREAAQRTLHQRHYDVQLLAGIVLHSGAIAEMATGEGKTLAATTAVYLNALEGKGAHVVTVNDYLAKRDAVWMGQIYQALGFTTSCLIHEAAYLYDPLWKIPQEETALIDTERDTTGSFIVQEEFLKPITRREGYLADITYGTNHEFGFDYLRDNLVHQLERQSQRGHHFAIVDEVDSILIDEARTPLIISAPDQSSSQYYKLFAGVVARLKKEEDYVVDEKLRSVEITEEGINKVEAQISIKDLYAPDNIQLVRYLEACLKAQALFQKDTDYVVRDGEIIIVDQFTGRMMPGRRYSLGIHQAIEAKENVAVQEESRTFAQISIQNYFRLYKKIAGMTGTAQTSAEEFHKVYNLEVISIPTNRPMVRKDSVDLVYKNLNAKYRAIAEDVKKRHTAGQPILIGTASIEKNEILSEFLKEAGVPHEILNAKNHEREGAIIAQAGREGAVTVATNMAGRGVDIILGGNPPDSSEAQKVKNLGGLHVLGTERHEARRIDNQLRGRSGRQGDPGSSQFFLSLEDDLLRVFGGGKLKSFIERFNLPDDVPIDSKMVSKAVQEAQGKVEGMNFDLRKHLLDFDDVLNKQRTTIYKRRQTILGTLDADSLEALVEEVFDTILVRLEEAALPPEELLKLLKEGGIVATDDARTSVSSEEARTIVMSRLDGYENFHLLKSPLLSVLDAFWMNHLDDMEHLAESVRIRAYGQRDPLTEYRSEGSQLFSRMQGNFEQWVFSNLFKLVIKEQPASQVNQFSAGDNTRYQNVGRNDPCPCGAKKADGTPKKYKHCHGRNA